MRLSTSALPETAKFGSNPLTPRPQNATIDILIGWVDIETFLANQHLITLVTMQ